MRFKTLILLLLGPIVAALVVLTIYAVHFGISNKFSSSGAWGAFGSYIGGTLGPLLAYFALIALLANLRNQQKVLALSEKTATRQWNYLQRKEKKDEWRDAIRDADRLLEEHLKIPVMGLGGQVTDRRSVLQHVAHEVRGAGKSHDSGYADSTFAKYTPELSVAALSGTATLVSDVWNLLDGFADNLTERDSRLLSFYISYFLGVTGHLETIGALNPDCWKMVGKTLQRTFSRPEEDFSDDDM